MYQLIATFDKNHLLANTHKFPTKDNYQDDLDIIHSKPFYGYSK